MKLIVNTRVSFY